LFSGAPTFFASMLRMDLPPGAVAGVRLGEKQAADGATVSWP
jgi:hypothetical protein